MGNSVNIPFSAMDILYKPWEGTTIKYSILEEHFSTIHSYHEITLQQSTQIHTNVILIIIIIYCYEQRLISMQQSIPKVCFCSRAQRFCSIEGKERNK